MTLPQAPRVTITGEHSANMLKRRGLYERRGVEGQSPSRGHLAVEVSREDKAK